MSYITKVYNNNNNESRGMSRLLIILTCQTSALVDIGVGQLCYLVLFLICLSVHNLSLFFNNFSTSFYLFLPVFFSLRRAVVKFYRFHFWFYHVKLEWKWKGKCWV